MTEALKLTKQQRQKVFNCRTGYGIAAYKIADNCIGNFEFFIDRQNRMCYIGNGKPVEFDVQYGEDGDESEVNIVPPEPETPFQLLRDMYSELWAMHNFMLEADLYEEGYFTGRWVADVDKLLKQADLILKQQST